MAASESSTANPLPNGENERLGLSLEAAWEIQSLCRALRKAYGDGADNDPGLIRGITTRIEALACAQMSALGDGLAEVADIHYEIKRELYKPVEAH